MMERYQDDYFKQSAVCTDFRDIVKAHRETQAHVKTEARSLKVLTSDDLDVVTTVPDYLIEDTDRRSGLYLQADEQIVPLRDFAINSLDNLCGVKGAFLGWLPRKEHAEMLNTYAIPFIPKNRKFSLFMEDEKCSGVLGAESFSEIPAQSVFEAVDDYLMDNLPEATYAGGSFSHLYVEEKWNLAAYADDFSAYTDGIKVTPEISISTSDCGASSVTLRPYLVGSVVMPMDPLRVPHKGRHGLEDVKEALNQVYALIEKGCSSITHLKSIVIRYPETTILRVMKSCKIPKEAGLKVAEEFEIMYGGAECTAFDIYQAVCQTLMMIPADATMEQRFRFFDDVARVAGINWKKHDLPGKYSW